MSLWTAKCLKLLLLPIRLYSASTSGLSTSKLRPISSSSKQLIFWSRSFGLLSFNFLESHFFLFVRAALVIIKPNCSQNVAPKMGPPHSPIFGTYGGHFCGRSETRFNRIGGPKLGPPKSTNWDPKVVPIFESLFGHHLLTAWCYFKIH